MLKLSLVALAVLLVSAPAYGVFFVQQLVYARFYLDCGPVIAVHDVAVEGCDPDKDCKVELGSEAKIHFSFTPQVKANSVRLDVYRFNRPESTYDSYLSKDACDELTCPLPYKTIDFTTTVPISDLKKERHLLKTTLTNEKSEIIMCAVFMVGVV